MIERDKRTMVTQIERMRAAAKNDEDLSAGREYLRLLRRTLVRIRSLTSELIEPHGLTAQQFLALLTIRDSEGLSQRELANELDSDANTVSAMVARLAKKELLRREQHTGDGRAVRLHLTEGGAALVEQTLPSVDRLSLALHSVMRPGEAKAIIGWLEAVIAMRKVPD